MLMSYFPARRRSFIALTNFTRLQLALSSLAHTYSHIIPLAHTLGGTEMFFQFIVIWPARLTPTARPTGRSARAVLDVKGFSKTQIPSPLCLRTALLSKLFAHPLLSADPPKVTRRMEAEILFLEFLLRCIYKSDYNSVMEII